MPTADCRRDEASWQVPARTVFTNAPSHSFSDVPIRMEITPPTSQKADEKIADPNDKPVATRWRHNRLVVASTIDAHMGVGEVLD